jgi:ATP-dependent RNA helicase RhlE
VGRTARAEATGDAFTFVSPQENDDLLRIERAIGKRLPRITVPDFDYGARPERLELSERERFGARGHPRGRGARPSGTRGAARAGGGGSRRGGGGPRRSARPR